MDKRKEKDVDDLIDDEAMRETQSHPIFVSFGHALKVTRWWSIIDPSIGPKGLDIKNYLLWKIENTAISSIEFIVWSRSKNQLIRLKAEGKKVERNFRRKAVDEHFIELS